MGKIIATKQDGTLITNYNQNEEKFPTNKFGKVVGSFVMVGERSYKSKALQRLITVITENRDLYGSVAIKAKNFFNGSEIISTEVIWNWDMFTEITDNYRIHIDEYLDELKGNIHDEMSHKARSEMNTFITFVEFYFWHEGEQIYAKAIKVADYENEQPHFELQIEAKSKEAVIRNAEIINKIAEEMED